MLTILKKISSLACFFVLLSSSTIAFAQGTILPETSIELVGECQVVMLEVEKHMFVVKKEVFEDRGFYTLEGFDEITGGDPINSTDILGCGIKTGDISLWMIPYYIRYVLEFVIAIAGLIAIAGIVYGGYLYLFAGFSDNKDQGKKAIIFGIVGFAMTLLAFALVNIVIALVTG